jgi:putative molybdopterin biosynthesis protein
MKKAPAAEQSIQVENLLAPTRQAKGLSRIELASQAGITRQAVHAIETNQYLPTTAVALRLADALGCRVEDLFRLLPQEDIVEGQWSDSATVQKTPQEAVRVKVARVGARYIVRPVVDLGEVLNYAVPADGLLVPSRGVRTGAAASPRRVQVCLLRDRRVIEQEIAVAGCDPSVFLAGDYLRRHQDSCTVVGWNLGSTAAIEALKRGEVHIAGVHVVDAQSGESNLPYLRRHLKGNDYLVVTFAVWEEGLLVAAGNPKSVRGVEDLVRPEIRFINREAGAGARLLLDQKLIAAGMTPESVAGYSTIARSHFQVARAIAEGHADVGLGVRAAAQLFGLEFLPLQQARYDLVIPRVHINDHPSIESFLNILVSRPFRTEIDALGGYDMSQTGTVHALRS